MTNYSKGYRLEWKCKNILEQAGYLVTRSPASKSEADLIAFNKNSKLMIQAKKTSKDSLYLYGLDSLVRVAKKYDALPLLVYGFGHTPAYAKKVIGDKEILKRENIHIKLQDFLKRL